jgi:hypothetical protein
MFPSRRALLAGALGGIGAFAAATIGRASPVLGADGATVHVGDELNGTTVTRITNLANANSVIWGESSDGVGVVGTSVASYGLLGTSTNSRGVSGESDSDVGIWGESKSDIGVYGASSTWVGVRGYSPSSNGVEGVSFSGIGVRANSVSSIGVRGTSSATDKPAILGWSDGNSTGVQGYSGTANPPSAKYNTGVYGYANQNSAANGVFGGSDEGIGVRGDSTSNLGVHGSSSSGKGVWGSSTSNIGVYGTSTTSIGLYGTSDESYGLYAQTRWPVRPGALGSSIGDGTGVLGFSGGESSTPPPAIPKTGVYGYAVQDAGASGVVGETTSGHGIHGIATSGFAGYFVGKVFTTKYHEMQEVTTPPAPGTNKARIFLRDNGLGKTQLCVRFHTGAVQVIKTEP